MFGAVSLKDTHKGIVQLLSDQNLRDRMSQ